ncbi:MAG TPA: hypothetical protein VE445_05820 [Nitrososphaeraceae archaeon]|jgi:hypothetical protein|nr:hypothetical protein [Nitrososphaeraceae archaeon]
MFWIESQSTATAKLKPGKVVVIADTSIAVVHFHILMCFFEVLP